MLRGDCKGISGVGKKVLILDDDPLVLAATQLRLSEMGYQVSTRDQVLGTSQWVVKNRPWLLLLDVMMPAMSGTELAHFLRRRGIDAHIILHSSKEWGELQRLARATGALGAIRKGLEDHEFVEQFKALVSEVEPKKGFSSAGG